MNTSENWHAYVKRRAEEYEIESLGREIDRVDDEHKTTLRYFSIIVVFWIFKKARTLRHKVESLRRKIDAERDELKQAQEEDDRRHRGGR